MGTVKCDTLGGSGRTSCSQPDWPFNLIKYWQVKFWKVQDFSYKKISNHRFHMSGRKTEMMEYNRYLQQPTVSVILLRCGASSDSAPQQRTLEKHGLTELTFRRCLMFCCALCQKNNAHSCTVGCFQCMDFLQGVSPVALFKPLALILTGRQPIFTSQCSV